jgi:hypothetical protein
MKCKECPVYEPYTQNFRWCQGTVPNYVEHECKYGSCVVSTIGKKSFVKKNNDEEELD